MTDTDLINDLELELISYKTQCDAQTTLIEDLSGKLAAALSNTDEASKIRIRELEAEKDSIFNMYRQLQAAGGEESNVDYQQVVKENQKLKHQMNEQQEYGNCIIADKQKEIDALKNQLLVHLDNAGGDSDFALEEIKNELKQKSEELANLYAHQGGQDGRVSELNHQILQLQRQNQDILQQSKDKDEMLAKIDQMFESKDLLIKQQESSIIELDNTIKKQKDQITKLMKVAKLYEEQSLQMKQLQQSQLKKSENESEEMSKLREHEKLYSKMLADSYAAMTKKDQELRTKEQRIKDLEDQIRAQTFDSQLSQKRHQSEQEHLKSQVEVASRAVRQNISLARQNIYQASPSSGSVMLSQTGEYRSTSRASQQLRASSTKLKHMMD